MADPISVTGKWILPDGRVVDREPVEGRLLVSPGGPLTPDVKHAIEQAEAAAPVVEDASEPDAEEPAEPDTEEAAAKDTATSARKRAASK
jgi:hypothetical protein